ncbi:hypothetical protein SDC9_181452 [bioreactor metagenome]|uniref:Uncharacterized protein n=1 Tax=bioreactor metagenome TaxID=1076179 RepID=A0A645H5H9_9ZZZZ
MGICDGVHAVVEQFAVVRHRAYFCCDRAGLYLETGVGGQPLVRLSDRSRNHVGMHHPELPGHPALCHIEQHRRVDRHRAARHRNCHVGCRISGNRK